MQPGRWPRRDRPRPRLLSNQPKTRTATKTKTITRTGQSGRTGMSFGPRTQSLAQSLAFDLVAAGAAVAAHQLADLPMGEHAAHPLHGPAVATDQALAHDHVAVVGVRPAQRGRVEILQHAAHGRGRVQRGDHARAARGRGVGLRAASTTLPGGGPSGRVCMRGLHGTGSSTAQPPRWGPSSICHKRVPGGIYLIEITGIDTPLRQAVDAMEISDRP